MLEITLMRYVRRTLFAVAILVAIVILRVVFLIATNPGRTCARLALSEYLHPTNTVVPARLPSGCVETNEEPPERSRQIIEDERRSYRLALQKVTVCRASRQIPSSGASLRDEIFDRDQRQKWFSAYIGCCTYVFRRHFVVAVVEESDKGSICVMATMIQARWDFLRFLRWNCDKKLDVWL